MSIILVLIGCTSAPDKLNVVKNRPKKVQIENVQDSTLNSELIIDYSGSLNYADINGLKQGLWIKKWKGRFVDSSMYVNDTLHGTHTTRHGK
ncbi:MAG: hypothetical protein HRT57_13795 [Crocinitomicaceae bacterium]|nr:hypothetical protein [Crocinitomicaceae bacterium]